MELVKIGYLCVEKYTQLTFTVVIIFLVDILSLKKWFISEKRDLPWRNHPHPYAIWISEVMLQQTQVSVVIPYFLNWMVRFPTIKHLAEASLDEVIKMWEGLGYYSRARNLHKAAKEIVARFNGYLPDQEEGLQKISGIGPYTVGAILSFAFHQKKAAVDGNVIRVLTRYFDIQEDIGKSSTVVKLRRMAQELLPDEEPWIISEALIELGAMICQKRPRCHACPLQGTCQGYQKGLSDQLPIKSKKIKIEHLHRSVAVIQSESFYLVKRGDKGKVMSDLYEFPYFDIKKDQFCSKKLKREIKKHFSLEVVEQSILPQVVHGFTRFQVRLYPTLFHCPTLQEVEGHQWILKEDLQKLAFSSGHRRIFRHLI